MTASLRPLRLPGPLGGGSPFARRGHVSHVLHEHTSVLAMVVERTWNLPALTYRDAGLLDHWSRNDPSARVGYRLIPQPDLTDR